MRKDHRNRIGLYECHISGDIVSQGKPLNKYYSRWFHRDLVDSIILPDLRDMKRDGHDFKFPVLVVTWPLGQGDPPKSLPKPWRPGTLTVKSAGGLRNLKRIVGVPTQSKGIPKKREYRVIIDERGNVFEVDGNRINTPKAE